MGKRRSMGLHMPASHGMNESLIDDHGVSTDHIMHGQDSKRSLHSKHSLCKKLILLVLIIALCVVGLFITKAHGAHLPSCPAWMSQRLCPHTAPTMAPALTNRTVTRARTITPTQSTPAGLANISSPFSSKTSGRSSPFSGCGGSTGQNYKFFVVMQPGSTISIGQTSNSFDSKVAVFWSESANPPSYPLGNNGSSCTDDPDTQTVHMTNTNGAARKLWFVVNGVGSFKLAWKITGDSDPTSHACIVHADHGAR